MKSHYHTIISRAIGTVLSPSVVYRRLLYGMYCS